MRPEPIPTVTTLSLSLRAHRRLPKENREEYDNHGLLPNRFTQIDATVGQQFSGPGASRWMSIGLRLTPDRLF